MRQGLLLEDSHLRLHGFIVNRRMKEAYPFCIILKIVQQ